MADIVKLLCERLFAKTTNKATNYVSKQFLSFLIIGGLATAVQLITLVISVEVFAVPVIYASVLSYLAGALVNYWLNYHYTFNSTQRHQTALTKFMTVVALGVTLNALLLKALLLLSVNYVVAQIIVIAVLLVFNYTFHKYWTYRSSKK